MTTTTSESFESLDLQVLFCGKEVKFRPLTPTGCLPIMGLVLSECRYREKRIQATQHEHTPCMECGCSREQ